MTRGAEFVRKITRHTEVGLPKFSPEERTHILEKAGNFVVEVKRIAPESVVDRKIFQAWVPRITDFARPEKLGNNIHAHHNLRHTAAVLGQEMFLLPFVQVWYQDRLPEPLLPRAVYAGAAGHDLMRKNDVWGAVPENLYKMHGEEMADMVRAGGRFSALSPRERTVAAAGIQYHDVDHRNPAARNPEDELLAIVDKGELVRLMYGVGPIAKSAQGLAAITGENIFAQQQKKYVSHYFPDLAEKIQPLSTAVLMLSLEGLRKGLDQAESVWFAMRELGMTKEDQAEKQAA